MTYETCWSNYNIIFLLIGYAIVGVIINMNMHVSFLCHLVFVCLIFKQLGWYLNFST